jgi:hypothetical protein
MAFLNSLKMRNRSLPHRHHEFSRSIEHLADKYAIIMTEPVPPRRGDKFAAMQQQQQNQPPQAPKRDKFAAMQSRSEAAPLEQPHKPQQPPPPSEEAKRQKEAFSRVWDDLQLAEAATLRLLRLARDTADCLTHADSLDDKHNNNNGKIPPVDEVLSTLQDIHSRLSPHAHLVKAYQAPTEPNQTYLAKVELGMARQKRSVIHAWNQLMMQEQQESITNNGSALESSDLEAFAVGSKRKRQDDPTAD